MDLEMTSFLPFGLNDIQREVSEPKYCGKHPKLASSKPTFPVSLRK